MMGRSRGSFRSNALARVKTEGRPEKKVAARAKVWVPGASPTVGTSASPSVSTCRRLCISTCGHLCLSTSPPVPLHLHAYSQAHSAETLEGREFQPPQLTKAGCRIIAPASSAAGYSDYENFSTGVNFITHMETCLQMFFLISPALSLPHFTLPFSCHLVSPAK